MHDALADGGWLCAPPPHRMRPRLSALAVAGATPGLAARPRPRSH